MSLLDVLENGDDEPTKVWGKITRPTLMEKMYKAEMVIYVNRDFVNGGYAIDVAKNRYPDRTCPTGVVSKILAEMMGIDIDVFKCAAAEEINQSLTKIFTKYGLGEFHDRRRNKY
jgi:hypothetical protein